MTEAGTGKPGESVPRQTASPFNLFGKVFGNSPEGADSLADKLGNKLSDMKQDLERNVGQGVEHYASAETKTENSNVQNIRRNKPEVIVASSDMRGFRMIWREELFYKQNVVDAGEVLVLAEKGYFDPVTVEWFNKLKDVVVDFNEMNKLSAQDFSKKHRNQVFALTKKYGQRKIYGKDGVFQFLNTYHRAKNLRPDLADITKADFDFSKFNLKNIKLMVGTNKGKKEREKDRYAMAMWRKKAGEPDKAPASKHPEFRSAEFYKKYDIAEDRRALFDDFVKKMEPWLEPVKYQELKDPNFWDKFPSGQPERSLAVSTWFEMEGKKMRMFFENEMHVFPLAFPEFFSDHTNPDSVKYQALNYYFIRRLAGYYDQIEIVQSIYFNEELLKSADVLVKADSYKDEVKLQIDKSAKYLLNNDETLAFDSNSVGRKEFAAKYGIRLDREGNVLN